MNTKKTSPAAEPTARGTEPKQSASLSSLYPDRAGFAPRKATPVGGVILADGVIEYNTGRDTVTIDVRNTGDRPIQVGSHFHFFEVNRYLEFDRPAAFGCHLNIPATTAVRFEPGDEKQIELVPFAGKRRVIGFNGLVMGYTGDENTPIYLPTRGQSILRMAQQGFKSIAEAKAEDEYARYEQEQQRKKNAENK